MAGIVASKLSCAVVHGQVTNSSRARFGETPERVHDLIGGSSDGPSETDGLNDPRPERIDRHAQ